MGRRSRRNQVRSIAVAAALGLTGVVTGCGPESSDDPPEEIMVDAYMDAQKPQQWVDWGSYVVVAEVTAEREIEPSYYLAEDLQGREVDLAVEQVLWSHPEAITPISAGQTVALDVSPGWSNGNPAVYEGDTRVEVGETYLLTLADSHDDGQQDLIRLFGSVSEADVGTAATVEQELSKLVADPDRAPLAGEAWDARFMRTRGYESP